MSVPEKEHVPNASDDTNVNDKSKYMNEDNQVKPKKCMPINYFFKSCENKVEWKKKNKHVVLIDNDELDEEEEEEEIKFNNNESKMMKTKVFKNNKKKLKPSNNKNMKIN